MSEPQRSLPTDQELIELIGQFPASTAAIGTVSLLLVGILREISQNIAHIAEAIDDQTSSNVKSGSIDRLIAAIQNLGSYK
jgi:hypothetical protein